MEDVTTHETLDKPKPRRFEVNPIIKPEMLPNSDGENINGPSLIKVPDWIENPLGKYYLYFAHHNGQYIRLAYSDKLAGPWQIHEPGTLHLDQASGCSGHIASPDVIIDEESKQLRMYFHGPAKGVKGQKSFVAISKDGLNFQASDEILGMFYFRVFKYENYWYAMAKGGQLYRSKDGLTNFEQGPNPFPESGYRDQDYDDSGPRHVALKLDGDKLKVYYSNIGDSPERILSSVIELNNDWSTWKSSAPEEVLKPETDYEGVDLPIQPSQPGSAKGKENALRDPAIFEENGKSYLLYSVAGESGIAIAEI